MRITCVQHVPFEGPGAIAAWARRRGHRVSLRQAWRCRFSERPEALVVLGGPMSTGDEDRHPWLAPEKRWLARQVERGIPVIGVCLGAQLLANVLGGRVFPGGAREIGWYPLRRRPEAATVPAGRLLPERFDALHWHGDTFDLPPGAVWLAESDAYPHQAFLWGERALGLQFHLEATPRSAARLADAAADELAGGGEWVQDRERLLAPGGHWQAAQDLLAPLLDTVFTTDARAAA